MTKKPMITDELLDDILVLEAKATEGPWYPVVSQDNCHMVHLSGAGRDPKYYGEVPSWSFSAVEGADGWETDCGHPGYGVSESDARFIVAMRNNIRAICEELKRLREELADYGLEDRALTTLTMGGGTASAEVTEHTGGGPGTVIVVKF